MKDDSALMAPARWQQQPYEPTDDEVSALIARAESHPLGTDYLRHGAPDSLAATFGVHAFVVDAARERLG